MDNKQKEAAEAEVQKWLTRMRMLAATHELTPAFLGELLSNNKDGVGMAILPNGLIIAMRFEDGKFQGCLDGTAMRELLVMLNDFLAEEDVTVYASGEKAVHQRDDSSAKVKDHRKNARELPDTAFDSHVATSKLVN